MRLRYTKRAVSQIDQALDYIRRHSPQGADKVRGRLLEILAMIQQQPRVGHVTSRRGVLRIAIVPHPYLVDYRVAGEDIIVLRFRHAARRPV